MTNKKEIATKYDIMLITTKTKIQEDAISMSIITSEARFRQQVVKYSFKHGVTKASNRFGRSRQAIYEWRAKWDGKSWKSLVEKSHRPHQPTIRAHCRQSGNSGAEK